MTTTPGYETTIGAVDPTTPAEVQGDRKPEVVRGAMVGRYRIIRVLGRGGMGAVYAALDPKLDRQVAIKLLHSAHGAEAAERMVREAQALARLDDPHVVQVYDAGEHDGQVFIAMQLVDGEDLGVALARRRANVPQILGWFVEAGHGLAAAHAAGLIHRDFKPNNVLIDRRGRVAVTDFGLAREISPMARGITSVGAIMGTPAYMSPEQHTSQTATEASDQFSFCVALWEALFDRHPFIGERASIGSMSPFEIGYQIYDGELIPPPKTKRVSRRVTDALTRGLARDPAQRWPSMAPLLAEIAPAPRRRIWPFVIGAGLVAAASSVGVWFAMSRGSDAPTCAAVSAERATVAWPAAAAGQIHERFAKTGRPYADTAALAIKSSLDRYAGRWQQLQTDVCSAERAASGMPAELVIRRRACLDGRLDALREVVALLAREDRPEFVDHASTMADALPDLGDCNDAAGLLATSGAPPAAIAAQVAQLTTQLDAADARDAGGDYTHAREDAATILGRADKLAWAPLQARAHFILGKLHLDLLEPARAELEQAVEFAIAGHLDREAAHALSLATLAAGTERSPDAFDALVPIARAAAARTKDPLLAARVELDRGRAIVRLHRYQEGATACRAAYATAQALDNQSLIDMGRNCMLEALLPLGAFQELEPLLAQLVAESTKSLGADHPKVADYLNVQAQIDNRRGKLGDARKLIEHVLEIRRRVYSAHHYKIAEALAQLAEIADSENKSKEALDLYQQALADLDESRSEQVVLISSTLTAIAMHHAYADEVPEAIANFEHAAALVKKFSPNSIELAILLLNYGQVKATQNVDAGLGLIGEARDILERNHDRRVGAASGGIAVIAFNAKRWADARKASDEALAAMGANDSPQHIATMQWILARTLVQTHGDVKRARTLAAAARATLATLGPSFAVDVKQIDAWLKQPR